MSCIVKTNRHGFLALQVFWRGLRSWEGTGLKDTAQNRRLVEAKAILINAEMDAGSFDYEAHFPKGNRAKEETPGQKSKIADFLPITIGDYYRVWIERKKPPLVRAHLEQDYRDHFARDILPKFDTTPWTELTAATLEAFRSYLVTDRKLAIKTAKNIINGSFRACYRDARRIDRLPGLVGDNPFADLTWPRMRTKDPDPFSEDERDKILEHFRLRVPHYYPFVLTQFLTGMRPSEALALRWTDIDFPGRQISITKSRTIDDGAATKTAGSEREIKIIPQVAAELQKLFERTAKWRDLSGQEHVFLNEENEPMDFHTFRGKTSGRKTEAGEKTPHGVWYRALRSAGVRPRGPYHTRHTFISVGLSYGANIKWIADYCGTSPDMIQKHYGRYIRNDVDEQLQRILGRQSETFGAKSETLEDEKELRVENKGKNWWAHLDSNQGPTGYEPVALTN